VAVQFDVALGRFTRVMRRMQMMPMALGMNGGGGGGAWFSQSDRSARSIGYLFLLRMAANPQRFLR
jgi:hypothetical protein